MYNNLGLWYVGDSGGSDGNDITINRYKNTNYRVVPSYFFGLGYWEWKSLYVM